MAYLDAPPMRPIRRYRREAGCSLADCAAACGLSVSSYERLERGILADNGRDTVGLLVGLAALFSQRLGRRISAQWDLAGDGPQPPRHHSGDGGDPVRQIGESGTVRPIPVAARRILSGTTSVASCGPVTSGTASASSALPPAVSAAGGSPLGDCGHVLDEGEVYQHVPPAVTVARMPAGVGRVEKRDTSGPTSTIPEKRIYRAQLERSH